MIWVTTHFEIVLVTLVALIAAVVVLQQRRTPQSAAAWLLFIIVVPYVAIPVFLALGFRKRVLHVAPIAFARTPVEGRATPTTPATTDAVLQRFGVPAATEGNAFRLLSEPVAAHGALQDLVAGAGQSILAVFYIVRNDPVGEAFIDALAERARAGVRVCLLLDRFGSLVPPRAALARLRADGGQVRFYSPFLQQPRGLLNLRNHRKLLIADGARVFAGGMNVGAEYFDPGGSFGGWSDLAFVLDGPGAATFGDVFRSDWHAAGGEPEDFAPGAQAPDKGTATVQLVPSGPDTQTDLLHDALVNAIHVARNRVWIATPYFLPTELLHNALTIAARRGVDVRILLPRRSNQRLADFARGAYLRELQETGGRIELYKDGMMHAKAGIVDDTGYVGSANFDVRSMLLNFEISLFVYDADAVGQLTDWFAGLEAHCGTGIRPARLLRRVSEGVFRLGAPVL